MSTTAILLAAGSGVRMGAGMPKALLPLAGRPMLMWSVDALAASDVVDEVVLVVPRGHLRETQMALGRAGSGARVVSGGASRAESVTRGLGTVPDDVERVVVHDAARPLLTPALVRSVIEALQGFDGAIAAAPVSDTLKRQGDDLAIAETVDRTGLWAAQTPQVFWTEVLRRAVARAQAAGSLALATDCASLVEAAGGTVRLVPAAAQNLKVTTPTDLERAEWLLGRADDALPEC